MLIRRLARSDYDLVLRLWQNAEVRAFLGGVPSVDSIDKGFEKMFGGPNDHYFVACHGEEGIGVISVDKYHDGINYEISYQFAPEFWGRGLACESILLVLKHIKAHTLIKVLYAETQDRNVRSKTLLKRLGMVEVGRLERFNEQQIVYMLELS